MVSSYRLRSIRLKAVGWRRNLGSLSVIYNTEANFEPAQEGIMLYDELRRIAHALGFDRSVPYVLHAK